MATCGPHQRTASQNTMTRVRAAEITVVVTPQSIPKTMCATTMRPRAPREAAMWLKTTMRRSCPLLQRQDGDSAHAGLHRHSRHAPTRRRMKTRVGCSPRQRMRERCGRDSANVRCGTTLKQTTKAINLHRRGHLPRMPTERHGRDARTRRNLRTLSSSKTATASVRLTASSKRHHIEFACARVGCADSTRGERTLRGRCISGRTCRGDSNRNACGVGCQRRISPAAATYTPP